MELYRVTLPAFQSAHGRVAQATCLYCNEPTVIGEGLEAPRYCSHVRYAWFVPGANQAMFAFEEHAQ